MQHATLHAGHIACRSHCMQATLHAGSRNKCYDCFTENCLGDGLYYKNDNMFVICSNGYPHEQPCPPGTKTAGYPSYKAGYYYGYTDLCSVNLVDYGLGPEHYAPTGFAEKESSYGSKEVVATYDKKTQYTPPKDTAAYGYNKVRQGGGKRVRL